LNQTPSQCQWDIFTLSGDRVAHLVFGAQSEQCWPTNTVASGIYLIRIQVTLQDGDQDERWQKVAVVR
jgi:hypothetical protein